MSKKGLFPLTEEHSKFYGLGAKTQANNRDRGSWDAAKEALGKALAPGDDPLDPRVTDRMIKAMKAIRATAISKAKDSSEAKEIASDLNWNFSEMEEFCGVAIKVGSLVDLSSFSAGYSVAARKERIENEEKEEKEMEDDLDSLAGTVSWGGLAASIVRGLSFQTKRSILKGVVRLDRKLRQK